MRAPIQITPAFELTADITTTAYGHHLQLISFVPTARCPEDQVRFQGVFSTTELQRLRDIVDQALASKDAELIQ